MKSEGCKYTRGQVYQQVYDEKEANTHQHSRRGALVDPGSGHKREPGPDPEPPEREVRPQSEAVAAGAVGNRIPVQGRLTDDSGNPLDGTYDIRFRLYDAATGGTALCEDTNSVSVENGLFYSEIWGTCGRDDIQGQQLYLGIKVEDDDEMTDRQAIYPVPYAFSLRPAAVISTTAYPALHVESTDPSGRGLRAYASATSGTNYGVVGASKSPDGYGGYFYNTGGGTGVYGESQSTDAVDPPAPAVHGVSDRGDGVRGETSSTLGRGVFARNRGQGIAMYGHSNSLDTTDHFYPTLYLTQENASGDFVVGAESFWGTRYWRVDRTGKGFFDGGIQNSGADFAEQMAVEGEEADYEPGDVLRRKARSAYADFKPPKGGFGTALLATRCCYAVSTTLMIGC